MDALNNTVGKIFDWLGLAFTFITDHPLLLALVAVPLVLGLLGGLVAVFRR